jgi:hypothetical protein
MNNIWRYLQTQDEKCVVVICEDGDQAENIILEVRDKLKRHSIQNDHRLIGFTRNSLVFGTNKLMCVQSGMMGCGLKGYTIHLLLLHENLDEFERNLALEIAYPVVASVGGSVAKYSQSTRTMRYQDDRNH